MLIDKSINSRHKVFLGSVFDLKNEIKDNSVDLIFADPPYNMGKNFGNNKDRWKTPYDYLEWSKSWIILLKKKLKENGSVIIMGHPRFSSYLVPFMDENFFYVNQIIYYYTDGMPEKKNFEKRYEVLLYYRNSEKKYKFNIEDIRIPLVRYDKNSNPKGKNPNDVWQINRVRWNSKERLRKENKIFHASQKPLRLLRRIILGLTNKDDLVLDPFFGTGTTSVVCKELGRRSVGIEINEDYLIEAKKRIIKTKFIKDEIVYEQR